MSSPRIDPTTDNRWLLQHSDRLIHYEWEEMRKRKSSVEMFPDEMADRIGRPKEYVTGIIKNAMAKSKARFTAKPAIISGVKQHDATNEAAEITDLS